MAITLKDISFYDFINYISSRANYELVYDDIYEYFLKHNIKSYQDLKNLLTTTNHGLDPFAIQILDEHLQNVISKVEEGNNLGKESQIFTFDNYEYLGIDAETLRITDNSNRGGILLYGSPANDLGQVMLERLNNFTITEIKYLLGHVKENDLKNSLTIINSLFSTKCPRIAKIVDFYDQQVLRQYFETGLTGVNLFELNREEKQQIITENLESIVRYIVENANNECVWGKLGTSQKSKIMYAAQTNKYFGVTKTVKEHLIDIFTNYTTLTELKNGICNEQDIVVVENKVKTLKRGIPINRFLALK